MARSIQGYGDVLQNGFIGGSMYQFAGNIRAYALHNRTASHDPGEAVYRSGGTGSEALPQSGPKASLCGTGYSRDSGRWQERYGYPPLVMHSPSE